MWITAIVFTLFITSFHFQLLLSTDRDLLKLCSSKIGPLVGQGSPYSDPKGSDKEVLVLLNFFQDSSTQVSNFLIFIESFFFLILNLFISNLPFSLTLSLSLTRLSLCLPFSLSLSLSPSHHSVYVSIYVSIYLSPLSLSPTRSLRISQKPLRRIPHSV